jgi:hypothetical protein
VTTRGPLDRRRFLQGLGGAMMLPFVPLLDVHATSAGPPRRIVFLFSGNGTIHESWAPKMEGGKLALSPILAPLERFQSRLLVVDGLNHSVVIDKSDRTGHAAGMNTALTGRNNKILDPKNPLRSLATGESVDHYLASKIGGDTKLRSIECGVQVQAYSTENAALSYRGPLQPILPESSPYRVFDRLFRDFSPRTVAARASVDDGLADRRRVLDVVSRDLDALRAQLPEDDRVKMEAHIGAVRALDHSLSTSVGEAAASSCRRPELGPPVDVWKNDEIPAIAKLQMDLLVMALACDLTRVGTIQFGRAGATHRFNWLGPEFATDPALPATDGATGFHALAHKEADPRCRAKLVKIHRWYAEQLAYLLERLAAVPEAGGTMLDNTVVVWFNELGTGGDHGHERTPWVIAGNARQYFKTGQVASFPKQPHNRLLLTLCHAMGVDDASFGDPDYCRAGPLTGVTA